MKVEWRTKHQWRSKVHWEPKVESKVACLLVDDKRRSLRKPKPNAKFHDNEFVSMMVMHDTCMLPCTCKNLPEVVWFDSTAISYCSL